MGETNGKDWKSCPTHCQAACSLAKSSSNMASSTEYELCKLWPVDGMGPSDDTFSSSVSDCWREEDDPGMAGASAIEIVCDTAYMPTIEKSAYRRTIANKPRWEVLPHHDMHPHLHYRIIRASLPSHLPQAQLLASYSTPHLRGE